LLKGSYTLCARGVAESFAALCEGGAEQAVPLPSRSSSRVACADAMSAPAVAAAVGRRVAISIISDVI